MICVNNRRAERFYIPGLKASISTVGSVAIGKVQDFSLCGINISNINRKAIPASQKYKLVINGYGYTINFMVKPCWATGSSCGKFLKIGFKIIHPPLMWKLFFRSLFPDETHEPLDKPEYHETEKTLAEAI